MATRRTRRFLGLRLPDLYAEDEVLMDAMTALHPTWGRSYLQMQPFGAKVQAISMATSIANGHDAGGGREPPGDVIGVAGVSLPPEAVGPDDAYEVPVLRGHAGGRTRRVAVGPHPSSATPYTLRIADRDKDSIDPTHVGGRRRRGALGDAGHHE